MWGTEVSAKGKLHCADQIENLFHLARYVEWKVSYAEKDLSDLF